MTTETSYDAIVLISFGGPEKRDDVLPFLDNVLRGRSVPEARKLEVAEHYYHFNGVSPINQLNREMIAALRQALADRVLETFKMFNNSRCSAPNQQLMLMYPWATPTQPPDNIGAIAHGPCRLEP